MIKKFWYSTTQKLLKTPPRTLEILVNGEFVEYTEIGTGKSNFADAYLVAEFNSGDKIQYRYNNTIISNGVV